MEIRLIVSLCSYVLGWYEPLVSLHKGILTLFQTEHFHYVACMTNLTQYTDPLISCVFSHTATHLLFTSVLKKNHKIRCFAFCDYSVCACLSPCVCTCDSMYSADVFVAVHCCLDVYLRGSALSMCIYMCMYCSL